MEWNVFLVLAPNYFGVRRQDWIRSFSTSFFPLWVDGYYDGSYPLFFVMALMLW